MENKIKNILTTVIHPAQKGDIVSLGMVKNIKVTDDEVMIIVQLSRVKDPFAKKMKREIEAAILRVFPQYNEKINVIVKEAEAKVHPKLEVLMPETNKIKKIVAVSSCKGGVGKSTITAMTAMALSKKGYKVGIIDTDIYGPSMPKMFDLEGFKPMAVEVGDRQLMVPAESMGIKIMSIGFFINPTDALVWRGPMATNALKQLINQTKWDSLDYLLIDLPPGTGDVHLTVLGELKVNGAIIVSTPQSIAIADVVRGIEMFNKEGIKVPILGLVENMAWFTPADAPEKKYYLFGKDGCKNLAEERDLALLSQIPLVIEEGEKTDRGALSFDNAILNECYNDIAQTIIDKI
ncbi:MAG: Mrp/NBP35 family ATP-binding protein [Bacteroidetes bacterium]|nr:Mrp/NBP35 family ATP-binding protein [Bacteroidota bacterium]